MNGYYEKFWKSMKVRFGIYETPNPEAGREPLVHARHHSKGTIRLDEMCDELRDLGVNSAQIKAVLDAAGKFIAKKLRMGYNVELDEIGIFSVGLRSELVEEEEKTFMRVKVDGVNFRCNKKLKKAVQSAELLKEKPRQEPLPSLTTRKKRLLTYLEKHGYINQILYAGLNGCSRYRSEKDLQMFQEEGLLITSGKRSHKVYQLKI